MATNYETANSSGFGTNHDDTTYVTAGVIISGEIDARGNGGGDQSLFINGSLLGQIEDRGETGSGGDMVVVGQGGSILNNWYGAIALGGGGDTIINHGQISSTHYGNPIYISGSQGNYQDEGDTLINTGVISGANAPGVPSQPVVDINAGNAAPVVIDNSGSIMSGVGGSAVNVSSGATTLDNTGAIDGDVLVNGTSVSFTNDGTLIGNGVGNALTLSVTDSIDVTNTGKIVGGLYLVSDGLAQVDNTGTIKGDVYFSNGTLDFDSSHGHLFGSLTGWNGADKLYGSVEDNLISGGSGNDKIKGFDGDDVLDGNYGNDTLTGGADADIFVFDSAIGTTNVDTITDFKSGTDLIELQNSVFTALTHTGHLSTSGFHTGTSSAAKSKADHIVYDSKNGYIYYDADGSGTAHKPVHFATVTEGLHLAPADFLVI